jgi:exodeoxyribonuclease V alpha subunit
VTVLESLDQLRRLGVVSDLDVALAELLSRIAGDAQEEVALAACLASAAIGNGDVCVDLRRFARSAAFRVPDPVAFEVPRAPSIERWRAALRSSRVVGAPGDFCPLVLDGEDRLYLHRYWSYEREIADDLLRRATAPPAATDEDLLHDGLERIFYPAVSPRGSAAGGFETDWQRVAAATAVLRRLCVVSGGPGTGKTTTVVRILALLAEQALAGREPGAPAAVLGPTVCLAAPTGKAAARLQEAVRAAKQELRGRCSAAVLDAVPNQASTIHRLLGPRLESVYFRHDRANPLAVDTLVIDESSMVDVALMAKVLRALPPEARLVLVGDKDQLASVEAGSILGDVCGAAPGFSADFRARLERVTGQTIPPAADPTPGPSGPTPSTSPLRDAVVLLRHSYRFDRERGIGAVAREVRDGRGDAALALLRGGDLADVRWRTIETPGELRAALRKTVADGYRTYLDRARARAVPAEIFAAFGRFRVLCAVRQGDAGVEAVNAAIADALDDEGLIDRRTEWYVGRPVMITRNDYNLRLFNGDVGIALADGDGRIRVHFEEGGDGRRILPPIRLPEHETVFAMTVHKSQGSEFDRVLVLLPPEGSRVLGRELLYTGVTRARSHLEVWGRAESLLAASAAPILRASGLRDALWGA